MAVVQAQRTLKMPHAIAVAWCVLVVAGLAAISACGGGGGLPLDPPGGPVVPGAPTITLISPSSGPEIGGTVVTITGTNLIGTTSVTFGATAGTSLSVASATQLTVTAPTGVGAVTLTVATPLGNAVRAGGFTYLAVSPTAPNITTIAPASGTTAGGTAVTITGTNFTGVTTVTFGGTNAVPAVNGPGTQITVTTPVHAAGPVNVVVTDPVDGTATASNGFTYTAPPANQAPELGNGDGTPGSVTFTAVGSSTQVVGPRDLAFNPYKTNELYIVTYGTTGNTGNWADALVVIDDVTASPTTSVRYHWTTNTHFLDKPSAIAFGQQATDTMGNVGSFATIHESVEDNNRQFMGPTLWPADRTEYVKAESTWTERCPHIDMLHSSSLAVGIAWESADIYWVFGAVSKNTGLGYGLCKYDFKVDHGPGNTFHGDGTKDHHIIGQLLRKTGVPGHMAYDSVTKLLYICDTGNSRVVTFDTTQTGTVSQTFANGISAGDGIDRIRTGTTISTLIAAGAIDDPCGIELYNNILFISDNATGKIYAYDKNGTQLRTLDTGLGAGAVMGLNFGPDGKLYFCDYVGNRIMRIDP